MKDFTNENIKKIAGELGYDFTDDDCDHLRETSTEGETVAEAVEDYLDAYER